VHAPSGERDVACRGDATETCGCDGKGACARHPAGTVCKPGSCQGEDKVVLDLLCDGNGSCLRGTAVSCSPFRYQGSQCLEICTSSNDDCRPPTTWQQYTCRGPPPAGLRPARTVSQRPSRPGRVLRPALIFALRELRAARHPGDMCAAAARRRLRRSQDRADQDGRRRSGRGRRRRLSPGYYRVRPETQPAALPHRVPACQ
jgi:hypothetical protein